MPTTQDERDTAIAALYAAFARYPFPNGLEAAPKHNIAAIRKILASRPLASLGEDELGQYAGSALYTIGGTEDYKHFLPRIVELSCRHRIHIGFEAPAIARKLIYADWHDWPAKERAALLRAFNLMWFVARDSPTDAFDAPALLCANILLGCNVEDMVRDWLSLGTINAALQLASLITEALPDISEAAYWDEAPEAPRQQLYDWLTGHDVWTALSQAERSAADEDRWGITMALNLIKRSG